MEHKSAKKGKKRARSAGAPQPEVVLSEADSEDEEVLVKTGRVPRKWYDNYKHLGYDIQAQTVLKQKQDSKLDEFIRKAEDPNWWRTVRDELNNRDIILSDQQLDLLQRVRTSRFADPSISQAEYSVEYDWDGSFPLQSGPIPKSKFLPSKWERIRVNKLVQAIKLGRIDPDRRKKKGKPAEILTDLWSNEEDPSTNPLKAIQIPAPKLKLPGHAESYNPSEEFLLTKEETQAWNEQDPEDRSLDFLPQKHQSLRRVPGYEKLVKERFERCLDLYLCPRVRRKKLNIDPESLVPNLPKPGELRPFPTMKNIQYVGHEARVRGLAVSGNGQFLASGDEDGVVILWEVCSGRRVQTIRLDGGCNCMDWAREEAGGLLAIGGEGRVILINPDMVPNVAHMGNQMLVEEAKENYEKQGNNRLIPWDFYAPGSEEYSQGFRIAIPLAAAVKSLCFHSKGDYLATVCPSAAQQNDIVLIHSLRKGTSQRPFSKSKAGIQKVEFHPSKPFLVVLTQKNTYIYNLQKQTLAKKLVSGAHWNSCLAVHPLGDNVLVGSYDRRVCWFDLDLSNTPYKTLRYHEKAIRQVVFHRKYPLFATASDDGNVNIFHATVPTDLMQNALIVPLKVLTGHSVKEDLGVLDVKFHPTQPWVFSAGADHRVILWT